MMIGVIKDIQKKVEVYDAMKVLYEKKQIDIRYWKDG